MGLLYDDEWTPEAKKFYNSLGGYAGHNIMDGLALTVSGEAL